MRAGTRHHADTPSSCNKRQAGTPGLAARTGSTALNHSRSMLPCKGARLTPLAAEGQPVIVDGISSGILVEPAHAHCKVVRMPSSHPGCPSIPPGFLTAATSAAISSAAIDSSCATPDRSVTGAQAGSQPPRMDGTAAQANHRQVAATPATYQSARPDRRGARPAARTGRTASAVREGCRGECPRPLERSPPYVSSSRGQPKLASARAPALGRCHLQPISDVCRRNPVSRRRRPTSG